MNVWLREKPTVCELEDFKPKAIMKLRSIVLQMSSKGRARKLFNLYDDWLLQWEQQGIG